MQQINAAVRTEDAVSNPTATTPPPTHESLKCKLMKAVWRWRVECRLKGWDWDDPEYDVLLGLAYHIEESGHACLIGYDSLAQFTGLSHSAIEFALQGLSNCRIIELENRTAIAIWYEEDPGDPDKVVICMG